MKTLLLVLLFTSSFFANPNFDNNPGKSISGLNVVTYSTKKLGKHVYIISDHYTKKKVQFVNQLGKTVYTTRTVGKPIKLSMFESGLYYIKVTENNKTQTIEYRVE